MNLGEGRMLAPDALGNLKETLLVTSNAQVIA
jgi:hypothetical protein